MPDLDPDRIARAALTLLDTQGQAGFTMRAVAKALGVTPMALYHHVKDKAALAALVVEAASGERPLPVASGDWREDLWRIALWARESTLAHPEVGRVRSLYRVWTPSILRMNEHWLTLWRQSGLSPDAAGRAATMSSMAIVGLMDQVLALRDTALPDERMLTWLPNAQAASHDSGEAFETVVRALIDGLHDRLSS